MANNSPEPQSDTTSPASVPPVPPADLPPEPKKLKIPVLLYILLAIAILIGGAVYMYTRSQAKLAVQQESLTPTPIPFFLTLDNLNSEITAVDGEIIVSGKTLPDTSVIIYTDTDETSSDSDENGNFQSTVVVGESGGAVKVTAYSDNGEEESKIFTVSQSSETPTGGSDVLGQSDTAPGQLKKAENAAAGSENENKAQNNPQTQDTPKAKNTPPGQMNKATDVETNDETDTVKIDKFLKIKTEKPKPVKIGAGKINEILSLEATGSQKLLRAAMKLERMAAKEATPATKLKRHAVSGVITGISGDVITLSHQIQQDRTLLVYMNSLTTITMKDTQNATGSSLLVGMRIAAVGEPVDQGILAKLIHVIPGKASGVFNKNPIATDGGTFDLTPSPVETGTASPEPSATGEITPTIPEPSETQIPPL